MNVALLIHGLGLGGAQQIVRILARWGDRERFRYFVYCCIDGPVRHEVEAAGATVRVIERHIPKLDPNWARRLTGAMRGDGIDLVHTHLFGDSLHGYFAAQAAGRLPVVMTLHAKPEILPWLQRLGYRWVLGRTARVIACSQSTQRAFVTAGWPGAADYQTIDNGIEDVDAGPVSSEEHGRLRRGLGLDPQAIVFGAVGRLSEEKGYAYLIRAFARIERPGVQLVLIGKGALEDDLRAVARSAGVEERVVFAGFRPNVRQLLPALDAVVFSSFSEGLSIALLEAMSASRPIVSTRVEGILEAARPDREALVVPVRSIDELAEALARLADDPGLRERLGQAARQRFLAHYTAERMVRGYEAMYREIHAEHAR